ncbi:MAG: DUF4164 family protein [Phenylobacterium sp.]|uniref:DUF4164 family protein n=1 Tax=Phenylobacterium sp. TaxID=1871053 RepID=UPI00391DD8F5
MIREPSESAIDQAARRLERALTRLEQKLAAQGGGQVSAGLFDQDAARLAEELEKARGREQALEEAGAAASAALGRAIDEIRAALGAEAAAPVGE